MKTIITTTAACLFALILALPSANAQDINILWEKLIPIQSWDKDMLFQLYLSMMDSLLAAGVYLH